jgi:hypothetical protein
VGGGGGGGPAAAGGVAAVPRQRLALLPRPPHHWRHRDLPLKPGPAGRRGRMPQRRTQAACAPTRPGAAQASTCRWSRQSCVTVWSARPSAAACCVRLRVRYPVGLSLGSVHHRMTRTRKLSPPARRGLGPPSLTRLPPPGRPGAPLPASRSLISAMAQWGNHSESVWPFRTGLQAIAARPGCGGAGPATRD